ncbi:MAG: hypothetical protein ACMUHY_06705 [Thermoplasmatota archaeon]
MDPGSPELTFRKKRALRSGLTGGILGALTGLVQISAGGNLPALTGNKEDTFVLGLITIIISAFASYCIHRASRETSTDLNRRIGWFLGALIPGVAGFTTVGIIWIVPGGLFLGTTFLLVLDLVEEFDKKDIKIISCMPRWRRVSVLTGFIVIMIPLIFGSFLRSTELASLEGEEEDISVEPMDLVVRESAEGVISRSEVTGVLIVHAVMLIGGIATLVTGQLGARTLTIGFAVLILVALVFFFLFLPNIMFVGGADFTQFQTDHFRALSGGWFMAMFGSLLILATHFIDRGADNGKHGQT